MTTTLRPYSDLNCTSNAFWAQTAAERETTFKRLRDEQPISWQRPTEGGLMPIEEGDGYWAVVRHADIQFVSQNPEIFCSGEGAQLESIPPLFREAAESITAMDAPRHTQLRRLVSAAMTPRRIAKIEDQIRDQARRIVDGLLEVGDCDFVDQVSMRMPMWTIFEMAGLPDHLRETVAHAADLLVSSNDPAVRGEGDPEDVVIEALGTMLEVGLELAEDRRKNPGDDLMTNLVQAEVDGQKLTDDEISAFFVLLSVGGNDTTRNTISHSVKALQDNPDQKAWLMADFEGRIGSAIEEFLRWASAVQTFKRVATCDTELHGVKIAKGEKVAMFYGSGNRDERVFENPMTFDLSRNPNKHLAFGGGGPHYCMGANLAKTQLRAVFTELLHRAPNLRVGEPTYLLSNFLHVVRTMPCTLG